MEKSEKKFALWKKILICFLIMIAVAGGVFAVLAMLEKRSEAEAYAKAIDGTNEILGMRDDVKTYLELTADGVEISDENKAKFERFQEAVRKNGELLNELSENRVMKDDTVKAKYDEATEKLGELQHVAKIEQVMMNVMEDGELSDDELTTFSDLDSGYLKNLASEMLKYRAEVAEFQEKYADLAGKDKTELNADYAKIQQSGNELAKKYEKIEFDDVYEKSRDDILGFYGTIEELNKILNEKK